MTDGAGSGHEATGNVLDSIDEGEMLNLAADLIAARGENPGETEHDVVDVLARACREHGFVVETHEVAPGRPNLLAHLDPANPRPPGTEGGLMFLGHSDVVPAAGEWTVDPYDPAVADGRLYGRGSSDMKGGLAAVVAAMAAVARTGVQLTAPMTLACTVDEEDLGLGIRALVADPPDRRYAGCVVAEPTDLEVVVACRGDAYLELEVTGVPAHAGRPADGRNAIDAAVRVLELVRADHESLADGPQDPLVGCSTWNTGRIAGGQGVSIVAPECRISLDRRLMPGEDARTALERLLGEVEAAGIPGDGITVTGEVTMEMPGFATLVDHPLVQACVEDSTAAGCSGAVSGWTAACDGGFVSRDLGIPTVVLGPGGINDQAHQVDESVGLDELSRAARLYASLILRFCTTSSDRRS